MVSLRLGVVAGSLLHGVLLLGSEVHGVRADVDESQASPQRELLSSYFQLVNADTDSMMMDQLPTVFSYDDPEIPSTNLNIQVTKNHYSFVGSIRFSMDNPNVTYCDKAMPFTLFRGTKKPGQRATYTGKYIPAGKHTIRAEPFDSNDCTGPAGRDLTQTFKVRPSIPKNCLSAIRIIDSNANAVVRTIPRSDFQPRIELGPDRPCNFRVEAVVDACPRNKIQFVRVKHKKITDRRNGSNTLLSLEDYPARKIREMPYMVTAPTDDGVLFGNLTGSELNWKSVYAIVHVRIADFARSQPSKFHFFFSGECNA